jgi:uncharacterized membrane protein
MTTKLKLFMIFSVALNMLLAGLVLGHSMHRFGRGPSAAAITKAIETLPANRQEELTNSMKKLEQANQPLIAEIRQVREKITTILNADSFDNTVFLMQTTRLRELQNEQQQRLTLNIANLAQHWTAEERLILSQILRRPSRMAFKLPS